MKTTASKTGAVSQTRGLGDLLYDKAGSRPSLDLDFVGTQSLKDKITGEDLVTHTRTTTGTYIDNAGTIKSAVKNLLTYSEDPNSWSTKGGNSTHTADYAIAPDGSQTASRLQHADSAGTYWRQDSISVTNGAAYTFSVWVKKNGSNTTTRLWTGSSNTINITDEWVRYSVTFTADSTTVNIVFDNSGAEDILFWHPQLEKGSVATDYV